MGTRVTQGPRSLATYARLSRIAHHEGSGGKVVRVRLRPLGGREVLLRPSTSDVDTVWGTFAGRYHLPPPEALEGPGLRLVWDLGANIGLTMADTARRHPGARIVGMELDGENAAIARANVEPWRDRCEVIEAAVWPEEGRLPYMRPDGAAAAYRVVEGAEGERPSEVAHADAISPTSLLAREGPDAVVDYVKLDIEGGERELLTRETGWAERVRTMKVEVHAPYTVEACERDLRNLGFDTRVDPRHWGCVVAVR